MISVKTVLVLALVAGGGAGCAVVQPEPPTSPSLPASASLLGTTWIAFELEGQPVEGGDAHRQPSLVFSADGDRVSGSTGCNRIAGPFTHQGSALRFGMLVMTRMACVPDRSTTENAFVAAIDATRSHTIENRALVLRDDAGAVRMRLRTN